MIKSSIAVWFGYFLPFEERVKLIKNAGFDEIMVTWQDEWAPFEFSRHKFRDTAEKYGLEITNAHSAQYKEYHHFWDQPFDHNKEVYNRYAKILKELKESEISTLVIHTTDLADIPSTTEYGVDFFRRLADLGEKYGVSLAVENVSRQYLLDRLLSEIDSDYLGLCYDSGHDYMCPCGSGKLIKKYAPRLKALHLQDNDLFFDRHWIPGEGQIDYSELIKQLRKIDYDVYSLEVVADPRFWAGKPPEAFLAKARQSIENLKHLQ